MAVEAEAKAAAKALRAAITAALPEFDELTWERQDALVDALNDCRKHLENLKPKAATVGRVVSA